MTQNSTQIMGNMGNRKQNYLIGSSIAAVAIALSLVAIIPAVQETPTQITQLNAMGHVTIQVADPDGNIVAYRQADNFVVDAALNRIQQVLFNSGSAVTDYKFLSLCGKGALTSARSDASCLGPMALTRGDGETGASFSSITAPLFAVGTTQDILAVTITITQTDADATFDELGLFDAQAAGNMLSVATFPVISTPLGTQVGMKYTITIGG